MSDKSIILKGFNNLFFEFLNDIKNIIQEGEEINETIVALEFFRKANPTCIIKAWNFFVYEPYKDIIDSGNISFFCDKDYQSDLKYMNNSDDIMKAIDRIRQPIRNMNEKNRNTAFVYMRNLCKLSAIYSTL